MDRFTLDVVRADDLLLLRFEFVNLVLEPDETVVPRRLIRATPGAEAIIIIHFPPQHIAERAFPIRSDGTLEGLPQPSSEFPARIADESRLGFRLPEAVNSIPLTLDCLLDWGKPEPVFKFEPIYMLDEEETENEVIVRPVIKPQDHHTAIEIPFRLTLSPDASGNWRHRIRPISNSGTVDLWHTRLEAAEGRSSPPQLKAIWSPDAPAVRYQDVPTFQSVRVPLATSLDSKQRGEIAQLSSDYFLLKESNFHPLTREQNQRRIELNRQRQQELVGEQLILSALGGTLQARSGFYFPLIRDLLHLMKGHEMDFSDETGLFSLVEWNHVAVMGRDQFVNVIECGYLYPLGNRAILVNIFERKFLPARDDPSVDVAYLTERSFLIVQEPERSYDFPDLPFTKIRITCEVVSGLDSRVVGHPHILQINRVPFPFPLIATDKQGNTVTLSMPMILVLAGEMNTLGNVSTTYESLARCETHGQSIAFEKAGAATVLNTAAILFGDKAPEPHSTLSTQGHGEPPFRPLLKEAEVRLATVEQFAGSVEPTRITYSFGNNGVFAKIIGDGVSVKLPAAKAGGIAAPNFKLNGLSRDFGAVTNVDALASSAIPIDTTLDLPDAKLLGVINLKDLVDSVTDSSQLPKFITKLEGPERKATFHWKPLLKEALPPPLQPWKEEQGIATPKAELSLAGSVSVAGGANFDITGELKTFALEFAGLVRIEFDSLTFHMASGQKPDFDVKLRIRDNKPAIEFLGPLKFIEKLQEQLPSFGGNGPTIGVTPEGVSAGIAVAVPDVALGLLVLQNIAVSANLNLFFAKATEFRFSLSSPEQKFLISYSLLGGGGFFSLFVSSDPAQCGLEASIEFGAVADINLVIARGVVQAMVGVSFSIKGGGAWLEGYIRLYGCLEVLAIVSVSVEFYLSLRYDGKNATGRARLTVMVRVLAFSKSVTLEVTRSISTSNPTGLTQNIALTLSEWERYCRAFA